MFSNLFKGWFHQSRSNYNQFMKALLAGDLDCDELLYESGFNGNI